MSKHVRAVLCHALLVSGTCLLAPAATAQELAADADHQVPDTPAWRANVGLVSGLGLAVLIPDEGSAGLGLELAGRYGVPVGPLVLAPGARVGGYYLQERVIGLLMPTFRVTVPLGPLAPYAQGGIGAGGITNPGEGGLAWLGGGGLMIHFGGVLSIGAEINYQGITGTGFKVLSIGPTIVIGG
jgi:hypothetical protein